MLFLMTMPVSQGKAADGSAGSMEVGSSTYVIGQPVVIYLSDMTPNADFTLDFTAGCADQINFTLGLTQTDASFTIELSAPTSGSTCTISLEAQSTGTALASVVLSATDYDDVFPDELVIGIAITILVISILVGIAVSMRYRK
jgi:hypothetical protein